MRHHDCSHEVYYVMYESEIEQTSLPVNVNWPQCEPTSVWTDLNVNQPQCEPTSVWTDLSVNQPQHEPTWMWTNLSVNWLQNVNGP